MSVLVNGMEMPEECSRCPLMSEAGYCNGTNELTTEELESLWRIVGRPSWCPLVEIPPHGRLIDADAAYEQFLNLMDTQGAINPCQLGTILVDATTIIEAEEGENG